MLEETLSDRLDLDVFVYRLLHQVSKSKFQREIPMAPLPRRAKLLIVSSP
jgi:hypothetical protein